MPPIPKNKPHPLTKWRVENRYTKTAFIKMLKDETGVVISRRSLVYWEAGTHQPRDEKGIQAIRRVTKGKVKPESFLKP